MKSDDESVDLSLPDSFDEDSFDRNEREKKDNRNADFVPNPVSKAIWLKEQKDALLDFRHCENKHLEYNNIKCTSADELSIPELVALIIHEKNEASSKRFRGEIRRLKENIECSQLELEDARKIKKISEKRIDQLREEISVYDGIQKDLEAKVRDLQDKNMGYRERERQFDALGMKCKALEEDIISSRQTLDQQTALLKDSQKAEKETLQRLTDSEKKLQSAVTEKGFLERENALLSDRVDRAETELQKCDSELRSATRKLEELSNSLHQMRDKYQKELESTLAAEVARSREEGSKEISNLYNSRLESWSKENETIRQSKQALEQELERNKKELKEIHSKHESELTQLSKNVGASDLIISELR